MDLRKIEEVYGVVKVNRWKWRAGFQDRKKGASDLKIHPVHALMQKREFPLPVLIYNRHGNAAFTYCFARDIGNEDFPNLTFFTNM